RIKGEDSATFLQGLVTNDILTLEPLHLLFAALLSPQGKILCDFFLTRRGDEIFVDAPKSELAPLQRRLMTYKLRARVAIDADAEVVGVAWSDRRQDGDWMEDPRRNGAGWRAFVALDNPDAADLINRGDEVSRLYKKVRINLELPEG